MAGSKKPAKPVHMKCRSRGLQGEELNCSGQSAVIVSQRNTRGGGRSIMYKCTTCGRMFTISF